MFAGFAGVARAAAVSLFVVAAPAAAVTYTVQISGEVTENSTYGLIAGVPGSTEYRDTNALFSATLSFDLNAASAGGSASGFYFDQPGFLTITNLTFTPTGPGNFYAPTLAGTPVAQMLDAGYGTGFDAWLNLDDQRIDDAGGVPGAVNRTSAFSLTGYDALSPLPGTSFPDFSSLGALEFVFTSSEFTINDLGLQDGSYASASGIITSVTNVTAAPAVPEPATWGLMILGFGVAGATLRRRRLAIA